jgi:hypothetical protein
MVAGLAIALTAPRRDCVTPSALKHGALKHGALKHGAQMVGNSGKW